MSSTDPMSIVIMIAKTGAAMMTATATTTATMIAIGAKTGKAAETAAVVEVGTLTTKANNQPLISPSKPTAVLLLNRLNQLPFNVSLREELYI